MPTKTKNNENDVLSNVTHEFNTALGVGWVGNWNHNLNQFDADLLSYYLSNPQVENKALRDMSWKAYAENGVVRNIVDYMAALPTLSKVIYSRSINRNGNRPPTYERNRRLFSQALDTIKHKEIIRDSIKKNCNDGISFYYFIVNQQSARERYIDSLTIATMTEINENEVDTNSTNAPNCTLFPLPVDYCKIVGIRNNAYVVAFNLYYFNQLTSSNLTRKLAQYPKEIRDAWVRHRVGTNMDNWVVLDNTKTVVTKVGSKREHIWGLPITASALSDILYYDYFTDTKRNQLDSINNRVVYQTFPAGKDAGSSALTGRQQEEQHNTVKNALQNRKMGQWGLSFFSLAAGTEMDTLDTDTGIFDSKNEDNLLERTSGDLGFGSALLNGSSEGNYAVLKLNLELVSARVFSWIEQFEAELNKVINYNIIRDSGCFMEVNYLPMTHVNKREMIGHMKELYTLGRGSWQSWVESTGIGFDAFLAMLDDEVERGLENKYPIRLSPFNMSRDGIQNRGIDGAGRPINDNATNENTIQSQGNNGNDMPRADV